MPFILCHYCCSSLQDFPPNGLKWCILEDLKQNCIAVVYKVIKMCNNLKSMHVSLLLVKEQLSNLIEITTILKGKPGFGKMWAPLQIYSNANVSDFNIKLYQTKITRGYTSHMRNNKLTVIKCFFKIKLKTATPRRDHSHTYRIKMLTKISLTTWSRLKVLKKLHIMP